MGATARPRPWATIGLIGTLFEPPSGHGRTVPRGEAVRDHLRPRVQPGALSPHAG